MISDKGICGHVRGGRVTYCGNDNVTSESICRAACDSDSLCLAYDYGEFYCALIRSSVVCANDYELYDATLAETVEDIIGYHSVCYTKNLGNFFRHFVFIPEILKLLT